MSVEEQLNSHFLYLHTQLLGFEVDLRLKLIKRYNKFCTANQHNVINLLFCIVEKFLGTEGTSPSPAKVLATTRKPYTE